MRLVAACPVTARHVVNGTSEEETCASNDMPEDSPKMYSGNLLGDKDLHLSDCDGEGSSGVR